MHEGAQLDIYSISTVYYILSTLYLQYLHIILHPCRYYLQYIYSIYSIYQYISTPPSCCTSSAPSTRGPSTACPRTPPSWSGSSRGASSWSSSMSSSSSIHVDAVWTSILYDLVPCFSPLTAIPRPAELRTWHRRVARHEARIKEGRDSKPPPLPPQQSVFSR